MYLRCLNSSKLGKNSKSENLFLRYMSTPFTHFIVTCIPVNLYKFEVFFLQEMVIMIRNLVLEHILENIPEESTLKSSERRLISCLQCTSGFDNVWHVMLKGLDHCYVLRKARINVWWCSTKHTFLKWIQTRQARVGGWYLAACIGFILASTANGFSKA